MDIQNRLEHYNNSMFNFSVVSTINCWSQRDKKWSYARRATAGLLLIIQRSATQQMIAYRLARRESLKQPNAVLQSLEIGTTIPAGLRLALNCLNDSETDNLRLTRHYDLLLLTHPIFWKKSRCFLEATSLNRLTGLTWSSIASHGYC